MGAWIETSVDSAVSSFTAVAPYVGAWIETFIPVILSTTMPRSHPTWVRGLKHYSVVASLLDELSHPTWVRGLKQSTSIIPIATEKVAPYVGAWIETFLSQNQC